MCIRDRSEADKTTDILGFKEIGGIGQLIYHPFRFKKYELEDVYKRQELSEEERSIFDLLKNIVSLGTKIHHDGIEFHLLYSRKAWILQ